MSGTIVLGYDGAGASQAALAETARIAAETSSDVVVVFAYYISPLGGGDVRDYKEALERHAEDETSRAVATLQAAGIAVSARHVSDRPADAILGVAEEVGARMIVVGGTSQAPLAGALLGSVALRLVQRSPVPLLVVPEAAGHTSHP